MAIPWDSDLETRLMAMYSLPSNETFTWPDEPDPNVDATATAISGGGVIVETSGRTIFAAPSAPFDLDELPAELADTWKGRVGLNPHMLWLTGRYVGAEEANANGAYWTTGDLEFGEPGVRNGPLNWLHDEKKVIGTLTDAALVRPPLALVGSGSVGSGGVGGVEAAGTTRPYIATAAGVWKWIYPQEARMVEDAAAEGKLWQSMECIAESVLCAGDTGCGKEFAYAQVSTAPETVCEHIRERSAVRRMVKPTFLGSGLILGGVRPGWKDAHVTVMPVVTRLAEAASAGVPQGMSTSDFERMVARLLAV